MLMRELAAFWLAVFLCHLQLTQSQVSQRPSLRRFVQVVSVIFTASAISLGGNIGREFQAWLVNWRLHGSWLFTRDVAYVR